MHSCEIRRESRGSREAVGVMNGDSTARYPALPVQSPVRTIRDETKRDQARRTREEREEKRRGGGRIEREKEEERKGEDREVKRIRGEEREKRGREGRIEG